MKKLSLLKVTFFLCVFCAAEAIASVVTFATPGVGFKTIVNFDGTNGAVPVSPPVKAINGNFYGTTVGGGASGVGNVYKLSPAGRLTTLYSFCSQPHCTDGYYPQKGLTQATDGNFYGVTYRGGANHDHGTVFKLSPAGRLATLYSFCSQPHCTDGARPSGRLVQATDGNFYGTTTEGGLNGAGNVFKLSPAGRLTTLYSFCSQPHCTDGGRPFAGLVQATDGNFYGTTEVGGANGGWGTVFKMTPEGTLTTLHSFDETDGSGPNALIQATDGNFYGTTASGAIDYSGTVFKITPEGTLTTLHSFEGSEGDSPLAGLIQATDGNFYGTTDLGGTNFGGTVFEITPSGTLTTLHSFGGADQLESYGLIQATGGNIWGTTGVGGNSRSGTVFVLDVGLGPFVETLPTSGTVGRPVTILGFEMKGATSVTFNGTPATFQVLSSAAIKTTVPSGATTGPVVVTTPSRTLTSNVNFQVN